MQNVTILSDELNLSTSITQPFDRIIATAGFARIPPSWSSLLASNGIVVTPIKIGSRHPIVRLEKATADGLAWTGRFVCHANFISAVGEFGSGALKSDLAVVRLSQKEVLQLNAMPLDIKAKYALDLRFFAQVHEPSLRDIYIVQSDPPTRTVGLGFADGEDFAVIGYRDVLWPVGWRSENFAKRIIDLVDQWMDAGQPSVSDYVIEVPENAVPFSASANDHLIPKLVINPS